jgi:hypothetical protein
MPPFPSIRPTLPRRAAPAALALLAVALAFVPAARANTLGANADALAAKFAAAGKLPPAPAGVTDLEFAEIFRTPAGPRGLEFTDKARRLAGQRVRILGFMVRQGVPSPGVLILAPYAMTTAEAEYGLCDDLPPAVVFVPVPQFADLAVPYTRGPLVLTGRLELGPHEEADGRISQVRLLLDPEPATATASAADPAPKSNPATGPALAASAPAAAR